MCTSPRQPEEAATGAAQRALEEEEEARLASASLPQATRPAGSTVCTTLARAAMCRSRGGAANLIRCSFSGPARGIFPELASTQLWWAAP